MDYGSYLVWTWGEPGARPVFVDGRIELYPAIVWDDYISITFARYNWEQRLDAWGVHTLMLDRVGQPLLIEAVEASSNWTRRYEDATTVIFRRIPGAIP
jgi:hypothetical protein